MAESVTLRPAPVIDPTGRLTGRPTDLARRPPRLAGGRVVLFDNGKLDPAYGNFLAIFDAVAAALRTAQADVTIERISVDLLATGEDPVARARRFIDAQTPDAVVLALADSGVTQRTVELARQLEESGVPCVVLAAEPGSGLAGAIATAQIPGLPIVDLPVRRTQTRNEIGQIVAQLTPEVMDGLTLPVAEQWTRFSQRFSSSETELPVDDRGRLRLENRRSSAATVDPNGWLGDLYDRFSAAGLGDGLPFLAPTEERVADLLAAVNRAGDEIVYAGLVPSGAAVTVEKLAANAVMAGCLPEYFPIVLAAFEAMTEPRYRLAQAAITSHPSGNLVLVSGPLADAVGLSGGAGCLGPGHRANATIGRALTLTLLNVGRMRPGGADLAAFGSPAEYSYCFAENRAASPWPSFAEEHYGKGQTAVLVHRCEAPHNVIDHLSTAPEVLLTSIATVAATLGGNNAYVPAELIVLLNPEHAALVAGAGWSRRDVQLFLWEEARNPAELLAGRGLPPLRRRANERGGWIPIVDDPDDIIVVVAGGPGPQSMVALPWGFARAVHRPIPAPAGLAG